MAGDLSGGRLGLPGHPSGRVAQIRRDVPGASWRGGEVVAGEGIGLTIDEVETYLLGE